MRTNNKGFTLIELMIVIAIIGILAAIAIPNFISYRNKAFCSAAESDANNIAAALSDYFAIPAHVTMPSLAEIGMNTLSGPAGAENTATLSGGVDNITITVTDASGRCPEDYQNSQPDWDSDIFTKVMR
ncbi:prepilin-type N-terminal cleavage/methylation domain-containing protein [Desulfosarcina widdelii]